MKTRKYEICQETLLGLDNPPHASSNDWRKAKEEVKKNPERFKQQREASRVRREFVGQSHLGSGGCGCFKAYFVSIILHIILFAYINFALANFYLCFATCVFR